MNREDWAFLEKLIERIVDLPPSEREAALRGACGGNETLLAEARRLVKAMTEVEGFLETPILQCISESAAQQAPQLVEELRAMEHYRIIEKLGEGGMGQVFLANQTGVERKVALKVIRAGFEDEDLRERFQSEYRTLALLEHENIARIYDSGATRSGRPYFTMEFFPGQAVNRFAEEQALSIRERILLFLRICEGVQHAHRKGIIHRDLKPSNILVRRVDGKPAVKIIDFGIAKTMHAREGTPPPSEREPRVWGTLAYLSPEQAGHAEGDTRTDIHGLGAVFYELLTGVPPFDQKRLRRLPRKESLRIIIEEMPPLPSIRLKSDRGERSRSISSGEIEGDLDWIAAKALARDPEQRYSEVGGLIEDLQHFLEHKPVSAHPPSRTYALGKFISRHRTGVLASLAVLLAVVLGSVFSVIGMIRAERASQRELAARAEAEARAADLEAMLAYLEQTLTSPNPRLGGNREIRMADVLARNDPDDYRDRPKVASTLHHMLGRTYFAIGGLTDAARHFRRAHLMRETHFGPYHPDTLASLEGLATAHVQLGDYQKALAWYREVVDAACPGPLRTHASRGLADLLRQLYVYEEALPLFREVFTEQMLSGRPIARDITVTMRGLGIVLDKTGRAREARFYIRWALETQMALFGEEDPDTLMTLNNYANFRFDEGRYSEAESLYRYMHGLRSERLGERHPETLDSLHNLCRCLYRQGRYGEALNACGEVVALRQAISTGNIELFKSMDILGLALTKYAREVGEPVLGREAEALFTYALATQLALFGPDHLGVLATATNLADFYHRSGRDAEAEALLTSLLCRPEDTERLGTGHLLAWVTLGEALSAQGKAMACRTWFETVSGFPADLWNGNPNLWSFCQALLVSCYRPWISP